MNKIGSPNLSISTSPSLTSPSNSTKSTSNSSTTSTSTATSSSTLSNSPSPALLSPNVQNRVNPTARLESPLASNPRAPNSLHSQQQPTTDPIPSNNALPLAQTNQTPTKSKPENSKNDPNNSTMASSSLLSTAPVPIPNELAANINNNNPGSTSAMSSVNNMDKNPPTQANFATPNCTSTTGNNTKPTTTNLKANQVNTTPEISNSKPTVPPLIIPVPQKPMTNPSNGSATKPAAKPKAGAKTTRKKSTEPTETTKQEPIPKPKPSRSRKTTANTTPGPGNSTTPSTETPKPEPRRAKSKAANATASSKITASQATPTEAGTSESQPKTTKAQTPSKKKARSASNESSLTPSPTKRPRKKKTDTQPPEQASISNTPAPNTTSNTNPLYLPTNSNLSSNITPLMINTPTVQNRQIPLLNPIESHDLGNRYFSPNLSPYTTGVDQTNAYSLSRPSISRFLTPNLLGDPLSNDNAQDDLGKAFEELRDNTWTHLSKFVLEQAQQFDIPSLIGTLHTLRSENEKLVNKVRDLTLKRDQLIAMNARLDMPGLSLAHHLNSTSPNFSSVVAGLTNSPKGMSSLSSPSSAMSRGPMNQAGSYGLGSSVQMASPGFLDRTSPHIGQTQAGANNIKTSGISTPCPPISALMAHTTNSRAGLITVNQPYMSNVYPSPMSSMTHLGQPNQPGSSFYPRQ